VILAGDVGGTKTTLAIFDGERLIREATVASRAYESLEAVIAQFLDAVPRAVISAVGIGIAGPVVGGGSTTTNLPWRVDERTLSAAAGGAPVKLINDLEATALGMFMLPTTDFATLQPGTPASGNMAVIAAGTGLGEALVVSGASGPIVIASEGGHTDFAPRTELEDDLLAFLRKDFGSVSYERVLSGPGLYNLYRFLRETRFAAESPAVAEAMLTEDRGAVITQHALRHDDPLCEKAAAMFVAIYGAEAGNLALKGLALGGVVVAGGIAPRILPLLRDGEFIAAFRDKGRLAALLEIIPVRVAMNPGAPLLGAARVATELPRV
jgi:glucokinase